MFDSHSHIKITEHRGQSRENINKYITMLKDNGIKGSIVTVDPFIDKVKCNVDENHFVKMKADVDLNKMICKCTSCKKNIYSGFDPYIAYNDFLIYEMSNYDNIHVFPVLSVTPSTTQELINYYSSKYSGLIKGFKGYTGLSGYTLDQIEKLKSPLPLLVHCGTYDNQNPEKMLKFASNFNNYLILAHFGALNIDALRKLNQMDNVFVDISPAKFIYDTYVVNKRNGGIFMKENISSLDDMYEILVENFDINKIVWGSDYPYSNQKEELDTVLNTRIFSNCEKEKILTKNIKKIIL